jgi:hypothetical protein
MLASPDPQNASGVIDAAEATVVHSQLTEREMVRFLRWRTWGTPVARLRRWMGLGLLGGVPLALALLLRSRLDSESLVFLFALAVVVPFAVAAGIWRNAGVLARAYTQQAPYVYAPLTWTLRPDGVLVERAGDSALREWRSIREIVATHDFLIFELSAAQALVLPRHAFSSPAASQKFLVLATELWEASRHRVTDLPTDADLDATLGVNRVTLRYTLSMRDVDWLFRFATRTFFRLQPLRIAIQVVATLALAGMVWGLSWYRGYDSGPYWAAIVIMFVPFLHLILRPHLQARQYATRAGALGEHQLWASPQGIIEYEVDAGIKRSEWASFSRLRRVGSYLVFERGAAIQNAIPVSEQDTAAIDQMIAWHAAALAAQTPDAVRG